MHVYPQVTFTKLYRSVAGCQQVNAGLCDIHELYAGEVLICSLHTRPSSKFWRFMCLAFRQSVQRFIQIRPAIPSKALERVKLTIPYMFHCKRFTQSASVESQETDATGVSPMSKKGPPPGEQEKRKTTAKVQESFLMGLQWIKHAFRIK